MYVVTRLEIEGAAVISVSSTIGTYPELWRAQNDAERLARGHESFAFDQERGCWQGCEPDGRTFRYIAGRRS